MKKLPHPWWHWFFTSLVEESYRSNRPWIRTYKHSCSKCRMIFVRTEGEDIEETKL